MKGRRSEKLTECFVGPYKVKEIVSSNAIELELPKSIKIHPVVNVSRVRLYKLQVEGQKKTLPKPVIKLIFSISSCQQSVRVDF